MDEPLDGRFRAFGPRPGLAVGDVGGQGWSVPGRDLPFPLLVLRDSALEHNLRVMHGWCDERGLALAPHGKTHMSPQLARRQLDSGAWGMTAANVYQASVMAAAGASRVLIANEVLDGARAAELASSGVELYCLVDSVAGVSALAGTGVAVLVELGSVRTGCRTDDEAVAVAEAAARTPGLRLAGVEGYEGSLGADRSDATLAAVDAFLDRLPAVASRVAGLVEGELVLSAGGSAYFDRVAARVRFEGARVVVRSGCYLTHDHGHYGRVSPLPALQPAFRLWAQVLSRPEPGLAIAGFGKRDAPFDIDLPTPLEVVHGDSRTAADGLRVARMDDQHAYLEGGDVSVGDLVVFGISHPCTAFDKWSLLPLVDDEDVVVGAVRTCF
jgi:D-serine dehydratase